MTYEEFFVERQEARYAVEQRTVQGLLLNNRARSCSKLRALHSFSWPLPASPGRSACFQPLISALPGGCRAG